MFGSIALWVRVPAAAFASAAPAVLGRAIAFALPKLEAVAVAHPSKPSGDSATLDTLFYRAVAQKQYTQAVVYGRTYLSANPSDDAFAIDLAYAYVALDRLYDARVLLQDREAFVRAHPQRATLWLDLAYKESAAKHYVRAVDDIDQYLQYHPDDAAALKQRAYDVAALTPAPGASAAQADLGGPFYAAVAAKQYDRALEYGTAYAAAHPQNDAFAIDLAFADISAGKLDDAATIAHARAAYIAANEKAAALLAALFYAYANKKEPAIAVVYGEQYLALRPNDDAFAMDLAYGELKLGNIAQARTIASQRPAYLHANAKAAAIWMEISYAQADTKNYKPAIADVDSYLTFDPSSSSAKAQRAAYEYDLWGGPRYQAYGYAQYEGRFDDVFFGLNQTYALAPGKVQPYLTVIFTDDLKSGPPGSPQIYSDNALIADAGLRTHFGPYVTAFVDGGAGIGLRGQGTISDFRYGLNYYQQWGVRDKPYTSVNASAAFYSRYGGNDIAYYTVLHDFGGKSIRPLIGINGGLDSHNVFGNNYIEGVAGFQTGTNALTFRLVQAEGTYLTRGLDPAPKAGYSTIRGTLFFGIAK
jgi:outer membrane protein assembly factor BamD (BamD/ComL family)